MNFKSKFCLMDVFLVKLSLILGHIATAMLPLFMT